MTADHSAALDHALAEALRVADSVRFRHDVNIGAELAYSAEAVRGEATVTGMGATSEQALGLAMRMLRTATGGAL